MSRYMQPYVVSGDIGLYFAEFEQMCEELSFERDAWSRGLSVLPSEAVEVVARLSEKDVDSYDVIKASLFRSFGISGIREEWRAELEREKERQRRAELEREEKRRERQKEGRRVKLEANRQAFEERRRKHKSERENNERQIAIGAIAPEKGPSFQECLNVKNIENEALAGLELETIPKDVPCVDEVCTSRPIGLKEKLETFLVPQKDVSESSNVNTVSVLANHSKDAKLQGLGDTVGEDPGSDFISADADNLARQSDVTENSSVSKIGVAETPTSCTAPHVATRSDDEGVEGKDVCRKRKKRKRRKRSADVSEPSKVDTVGGAADHSKDSTLQGCSDAIGEGPVSEFVSVDTDNLARQSDTAEESKSLREKGAAQAPTSCKTPHVATRSDDRGIERKEVRRHRRKGKWRKHSAQCKLKNGPTSARERRKRRPMDTLRKRKLRRSFSRKQREGRRGRKQGALPRRKARLGLTALGEQVGPSRQSRKASVRRVTKHRAELESRQDRGPIRYDSSESN